MVAVSKQPRSFSIDEDLNEVLSERDDINASAAVNTFLREYVAAGKGDEAALAVRLEQLDDEIADLEAELKQLERERERIQTRLESKRSKLDDQLDHVLGKIRNDEFPRDNINPDNPAIQKWASEAGVETGRFVNELEGRL